MLFEFGRRLGEKGKQQRGSCKLWIYLADWWVWDESRQLAHSESPDDVIHEVARTLTGRKLIGVSLHQHVLARQVRHGFRLYFEGGFQVEGRSYEDSKARAARKKSDDELLFLYTPKAVFHYDWNGRLKVEAREG